MRVTFFNWWKNPRSYITAVCVGVLVGTVMSIYTGVIDFVSGPFVWLGCLLALREVWIRSLS